MQFTQLCAVQQAKMQPIIHNHNNDNTTEIPPSLNDAYATSFRKDHGGGVENKCQNVKPRSMRQDVSMVQTVAYTSNAKQGHEEESSYDSL